MRYNFYLQDLTNNSQQEDIIIQPASYSVRSVTENDQTFIYRKAIIPISLKLLNDNLNNISLFKFQVTDSFDKPIRGAERTITIQCLEANS